jgi:hypothetical protein
MTTPVSVMRIGNYRIDFVYGQVTPQLRGELVQFWLDEGALPDANTAWARADQTVCIARDPTGAIASVNTVYLGQLHGTGELHYVYRAFSRPRDRTLALTTGMSSACRDYLAASPLRDPRASGFVIIAQNPKLQSPAGHRLLSGRGWNLVGSTEHGNEVWRRPFPEAGG